MMDAITDKKPATKHALLSTRQVAVDIIVSFKITKKSLASCQKQNWATFSAKHDCRLILIGASKSKS
ncbi:MAG: hypothetical protein ACK6DC_19055 [Planctomycetota bacterium]|jgi:DNA-binding transcriptional regulator YhcF (GntR family)